MPILIPLALAVVIGITFMAFKYGGATKILVGTLILITIGFVNPGNLGSIMLFSIVCTAGVGLIPFFLIAWIIGSVVMVVVDAIRTQNQPTPATAGTKRDQ